MARPPWRRIVRREWWARRKRAFAHPTIDRPRNGDIATVNALVGAATLLAA
jgi:hypothetical protein